jgi:MFS transporter, DHA2 family, glioxin efflux transporter
MSQVTAINMFMMLTGGSFLLASAQSAFTNALIKLPAMNLPKVNNSMAIGTGATRIRQAFTPEQVPNIIDAYMEGLKNVFLVAAAAYALATLVGFLTSWKRLNLGGAAVAAA